MSKKPFLSRIEQYKRTPTLRNRSLILAQQIDALKCEPGNSEFKKILHRAIIEVRELGRLDKRAKRARVMQALKEYVCELDEIIAETKLKRREVLRALAVLKRANLLVLTRRPHFLNPDGSHGTIIYQLKGFEIGE